MGEEKNSPFGDFLRALAEIADNKPVGTIELTCAYADAVAQLAEHEPSSAKAVLKLTGPIVALIRKTMK